MKRRPDDAEVRADPGDLFAWAERQRSPKEEATIRAAFFAFHAKYPEVYALFERFALEAIHAGRESIGAKAVWERMRWETAIGSARTNSEQYRLNNNFTAYYAREFVERHPELADVFETRRVRS